MPQGYWRIFDELTGSYIGRDFLSEEEAELVKDNLIVKDGPHYFLDFIEDEHFPEEQE